MMALGIHLKERFMLPRNPVTAYFIIFKASEKWQELVVDELKYSPL